PAGTRGRSAGSSTSPAPSPPRTAASSRARPSGGSRTSCRSSSSTAWAPSSGHRRRRPARPLRKRRRSDAARGGRGGTGAPPGPAGAPPGPHGPRHRGRRPPRLPRGPGRAVGRGPPAARRRARRGHRRLAPDDADQLARFASDVVPTLRAAVAAERERRGTPPAPTRSTAQRAARRPGIAYDDVPAALADGAVEPGDAAYARVRSTYLRGGSPGLVLRPGTAEEVAQALAFARGHDVPLSLRSGGHGISGRSTNDGGIVIDLARMTRIEVL